MQAKQDRSNALFSMDRFSACPALCGVMVFLVMLALPLLSPGSFIKADDPTKEQQLLIDAAGSFQDLMNDPEYRGFRRTFPKAKAIFIVPSMVRGGLILGVESGTGVLLKRKSDNGGWGQPVFLTLKSGSVGIQIGFQSSSSIFLIMNEKGVDALLAGRVKLGGDLAISLGPVGGSVQASATSDLESDIYAYSKGAGLFAGGAIEGSWLNIEQEWIENYYGPGATASDVINHDFFQNPNAHVIIDALSQ